MGLRLNNKQFPYRQIDYLEPNIIFTQESFTLRNFFTSSDNKFALIGNFKFAYKPGSKKHHWETTLIRVLFQDGKLNAEMLPVIEINDIY